MTRVQPGALACLHIAFPEAVEEEVVDLCHATPALPGFTVVEAAGFGRGARLHTIGETVLGRARRRLLMVVAEPDVLAALLESLRRELPTPDIAYWVLPVAAFGRLA